MKTLIVSTPIRPVPTSFPPFGSLALLQYLRKNGVDDVDFYNIDANRPTFEEAVDEIVRRNPGILGISAVVSTAYEYTKRLSAAVRERLPDILIVLGGNMGASANVLLHKTEVDLVVVGEGEVVFLNLIRKAEETRNPVDFKDVRGLALLDENGVLINTGYEPQIAPEEIYDISWADLKRTTDRFEIYFPTMDVSSMKDFHMKGDSRYHDERRHGKAISSLYTAKGCVSRCTFCHRWDKGIRFIPVPVVMERLDELIRDYDVGYLNISDENFGTDRRWLKEFCGEIAKRDVLWTVGTRVTGITEEMVEMMKDAGCVAIIYGNETGSKRMLEIMEKKVSIQDNYEAMRWTIERGLRSVVQLVLGMPGECPETIRETIEYVKYCNTIDPRQNPNDLSINYAQALPGTPLYEFARSKGMIGRSLEEEEAYLLSISDRDAHDEYTTLNFTDYPK
ncbi:MAG: radical SAM protein, partial [Rhodospirillales bacterium]